MIIKKTLLSLVLISGLAAGSLGSLFAVDFSLRINPGVAIPLKEHYKPSANVTAQADLQLFDTFTIGGEGSFLYETPEGASSSVNFLYGGFGFGLYHNIFSRLYVGAGGGAGARRRSLLDSRSGEGTDRRYRCGDFLRQPAPV